MEAENGEQAASAADDTFDPGLYLDVPMLDVMDFLPAQRYEGKLNTPILFPHGPHPGL